MAIGTTARDSETVAAIAREYPGVFAAVGIHPNEAAEATPEDWQAVLALLEAPNVVALGETGNSTGTGTARRCPATGLVRSPPGPRPGDRAPSGHPLPRQSGRPDCSTPPIQAPVHGVLHSFTGTWEDASVSRSWVAHISFAGMVTFTNRTLDTLRDVAARVPGDRLLVETDSPYLCPHPIEGERTSQPGQLHGRAGGACACHFSCGTRPNHHINARRLFRLPEQPSI